MLLPCSNIPMGPHPIQSKSPSYHKTLMNLTPASPSLPSRVSCSIMAPSLSALVLLVSKLLLKPAKHIPASGPLQNLFPPLGIFLPQISRSLIKHHCTWSPYFKQHLTVTAITPSPMPCFVFHHSIYYHQTHAFVMCLFVWPSCPS